MSGFALRSNLFRFPRSDALFTVPNASQVRDLIYDFLKCCDFKCLPPEIFACVQNKPCENLR